MSPDRARRLDLSGWGRREHYLFFKEFEQPFFNVCVDLDVTALVELSRARERSFFLALLYLSLEAANGVRELRLRIRGDEVWEHPRIHCGSTVFREDHTFGFGYFESVDDFEEFERRGRAILEQVRHSSGRLDDQPGRDDLFYCSVLPWVAFTSFAHARRCPVTESIPRLVFGKRHERREGTWHLPMSVEVHHALVDGLHVGRFVESFQEGLSEPAASLGLG